MTDRITRRRMIALSGATVTVALAGCNDEGPGEEEEPNDDPIEDDPGEDPGDEEDEPGEDGDEDGLDEDEDDENGI